MTSTEAYDRDISSSYSTDPDETTARLADLAALVELGLGHPLNPLVFTQLAVIQEDLRTAQDSLVQQLQEGSVTPEGYLDLFNEELKKWTDRNLHLLGLETFEAIFGKEGHHPEAIIDRKIFLRQPAADP